MVNAAMTEIQVPVRQNARTDQPDGDMQHWARTDDEIRRGTHGPDFMHLQSDAAEMRGLAAGQGCCTPADAAITRDQLTIDRPMLTESLHARCPLPSFTMAADQRQELYEAIQGAERTCNGMGQESAVQAPGLATSLTLLWNEGGKVERMTFDHTPPVSPCLYTASYLVQGTFPVSCAGKLGECDWPGVHEPAL